MSPLKSKGVSRLRNACTIIDARREHEEGTISGKETPASGSVLDSNLNKTPNSEGMRIGFCINWKIMGLENKFQSNR
ncbi:hypothetical protein EUGRSUZ_C01988 [Eucalyptus grandis]|uniref:Uncharacterized protein n=2 Tax=Eucalyptus grandis TaxID=71139 RepID=A0ACC3LEH8_EUCGR|nr:hypothetical protein EUGRSUZ_C01988 [Eucalyptus grandis]